MPKKVLYPGQYKMVAEQCRLPGQPDRRAIGGRRIPRRPRRGLRRSGGLATALARAGGAC